MELRKNKVQSTKKSSLVKEDNTVSWYLDNIKNNDVIPHDKMQELFKKLHSGDKQAMNELVSRNLKLVVAVARTYRDKGVDWEDLIQEGNMGLIHAIEKFEWERGHRFSTYATWWIRQRISHYLSTQRHSIRVPTHALRLKKHIEIAIDKLRKEGIEEPSWEIIANMVDSSADVVEATMSGTKATVSLSQPVSSNEKESIESKFKFDEMPTVESPEYEISLQQIKDVLIDSVNALDPLDRHILEIRIGKYEKQI